MKRLNELYIQAPLDVKNDGFTKMTAAKDALSCEALPWCRCRCRIHISSEAPLKPFSSPYIVASIRPVYVLDTVIVAVYPRSSPRSPSASRSHRSCIRVLYRQSAIDKLRYNCHLTLRTHALRDSPMQRTIKQRFLSVCQSVTWLYRLGYFE